MLRVTADFAAAVQKFINSPPGQFAAGGVLARIVWKFFEQVENVLTDETKSEIAVWLSGVNVAQRVRPWTEVFGFIFIEALGNLDRNRLRRLYRVGLFSFCSVVYTNSLARFDLQGFGYEHLWWLLCLVVASTISNYIHSPNTVAIIGLLRRRSELLNLLIAHKQDITGFPSFRKLMLTHIGEIAASGISWSAIAIGMFYVGVRMTEQNPDMVVMLYFRYVKAWLLCFSLFFLSPFCFFLYAAPGFLHKVARRFDINFKWFNRKFDIERKPLSAIGIVCGAICAIGYWGLATVFHFL